ncbi:hypothetical protein GCM10008966_00150 [Rhodovulum strictum]
MGGHPRLRRGRNRFAQPEADALRAAPQPLFDPPAGWQADQGLKKATGRGRAGKPVEAARRQSAPLSRACGAALISMDCGWLSASSVEAGACGCRAANKMRIRGLQRGQNRP